MNEVEKLSELMRGLEIPPAAATFAPSGFYALGRAIADQAKEAPALNKKVAALQAELERVRAETVEECAKVCDDRVQDHDNYTAQDHEAEGCADAIRALTAPAAPGEGRG